MSSSIPKTMRAVQLVGYKQRYEVRDVPVPTHGDNDLLVKVGAAGFCHTDYQVWEGVYESPTPLIPSHEPVGAIVAMGSQAQKTGKWKIGQRVGVIMFRHACHKCVGCETTSETRFCKVKEAAGLTHDGGMAEYIIGDADECVALPDSVPFEQAAPLMCAGATTWSGLMAVDVKGPAPIGILGIGGLGALAVQFAKALGYSVVAIDNRPEGRALATEVPLPADLVIDSTAPDAVTRIKDWAGRDGLAAIIVCTDNVEGTEWSLNTLRPRGVCVPLGLPTAGDKLNAFTMIFNELTIKGSLVANRERVEDMMKIVVEHGITHHVTTFGLEDTVNAPDWYMASDLKGRLVMKISS